MSAAVRADDLVGVLDQDGGGSLRTFLARQRWFAAKARGIEQVRAEDWAVLEPRAPLVLVLLQVDGDRYYLPVTASDGGTEEAIAREGSLRIIDAHAVPALGRHLLLAIAENRELDGRAGRFVCRALSPWKGPPPERIGSLDVRVLAGEQTNTSLALGSDLILKSFRRPSPGINPEIEIGRFLTERTAFRHSPALVGWIDYTDGRGDPAAVGVVQELIANTGDGWRHVLAGLGRALDAQASARSGAGPAVDDGEAVAAELGDLGRITGELHAALAVDAGEPAFAPEPVTADDARRWSAQIGGALTRLAQAAAAGRAGADVVRALGELAAAPALGARIAEGIDRLVAAGAHKIRCHGDYHLGQVLKTPDSFAVIDFEGEPARPLEERRRKYPSLRDVAGMLRSFDYAAHSALRARPADERAFASRWLEGWQARAREAFLRRYEEAVSASPVRLVPPSRGDLLRACAAFEIDKACYELDYELNNRPDWVPIPLAGLLRLLQ